MSLQVINSASWADIANSSNSSSNEATSNVSITTNPPIPPTIKAVIAVVQTPSYKRALVKGIAPPPTPYGSRKIKDILLGTKPEGNSPFKRFVELRPSPKELEIAKEHFSKYFSIDDSILNTWNEILYIQELLVNTPKEFKNDPEIISGQIELITLLLDKIKSWKSGYSYRKKIMSKIMTLKYDSTRNYIESDFDKIFAEQHPHLCEDCGKCDNCNTGTRCLKNQSFDHCALVDRLLEVPQGKKFCTMDYLYRKFDAELHRLKEKANNSNTQPIESSEK